MGGMMLKCFEGQSCFRRFLYFLKSPSLGVVPLSCVNVTICGTVVVMNWWQSKDQKQNLKGGEGEWNLNLNLIPGMSVGMVSYLREGGSEHSGNLLSEICSQRVSRCNCALIYPQNVCAAEKLCFCQGLVLLCDLEVGKEKHQMSAKL